jgi:DNA-binding transcriptional LysR family regulator
MLDFELLRAFVAVADCGGFHRAERLNLTQSTISQQIKRLELETKRPLFRRTTRSVGLTDDGEMLLGDARRLLQLEEVARYRFAAPRLSGSVRLGVVEEVAGDRCLRRLVASSLSIRASSSRCRLASARK